MGEKDGEGDDKESTDGKEEAEPEEGKIKTHEVDSVIDKMNMLNEMFESILKHMTKLFQSTDMKKKIVKERMNPSQKGKMMMKRKKKKQKVMKKNQQMAKKTKVKKKMMEI